MLAATILFSVLLAMYRYDRNWKRTACFVYNTPIQSSACINLTEAIFAGFGYDEQYSEEARKLYYKDYLEIINKRDEVDKVYGFDVCEGMCWSRDSVVEINTGYEYSFDILGLHLSQGKWPTAEPTEDGIPNAVVCGPSFSDASIGDIILISPFYTETDPEYEDAILHPEKLESKRMQVRIVGKVDFPYRTPCLDGYLHRTYPFASYEDLEKVFLVHNDQTVKVIESYNFRVAPQNRCLYVKLNNSEDSYEKLKEFADSVWFDAYNGTSFIFPTSQDVGEARHIIPFNIFTYFTNPIVWLVMAFIWLAMTLALLHTINKISKSHAEGKGKRFSARPVISAIFFMIFVPAIIACAIFLLIEIGQGAGTGNSEFGRIIEGLCSEYLSNAVIAVMFMALVISSCSIIMPIRKMFSSKHSEELTKQAFTYRKPEYYTEESYEPNDFEAAQYPPPDQQKPQDPENNNKTE